MHVAKVEGKCLPSGESQDTGVLVQCAEQRPIDARFWVLPGLCSRRAQPLEAPLSQSPHRRRCSSKEGAVHVGDAQLKQNVHKIRTNIIN